ncbi:hypothetical protein LTR84_003990 [Exophiala bonariae]|uniref:Uncharacterized protein n=1 Tax=Exophiala bonariae TaxID=1690606 RepID=A0AAV9N516_9EURO|nr:hypothetical protein LTR84_003990 [Exophiala bonariae]
MASLRHSFGILLSTLILAHLVNALELVAIRPRGDLGPKSRLRPRDTSLLDLRSTETFLWGADNSSAPLANFTIYAPENNRNVLSMEKFDGMLLSCNATQTGLELQFEDDQTFAYAQRVWDWVNGADNHTFLMVVGAGDCSNNPYRVPYSVSDIVYDEDLNIAHLNATTGSWRDLAPSFQLQVGNVATPQTPQSRRLRERDITKEVSFPLANELPFVAKVEQGPIIGELECENCRTTGKIDFELRVTQNAVGLPDGVELKMSPTGVSAVANLKLKLGSNFKSKKEVFKETVLSFPLNSITIPPDILNVGPFLDIDAGVEVTGVEGSITVTGGVTSKISDSAILRANLFDPLDNEFSGWLPDIDFLPPEIEAQVSATLQMFFMPAVRLKAEALGQGVEAGLELKLPFIDLKLEATANSKGGVCDDPAKTIGVEIEPSIGAEFKFEAGTTDGEKTPIEVTIATTSFPLGGICFGTNPDGNDAPPPPASSSKSSPAAPKSSSKASTATSAPATKCTANNGIFGSTSSNQQYLCPQR